MDFISTALVTLRQPTGFWETILNAFKSATGTYILAVILLALIVRILFSLVDIINKKVNMKNMDINAKMRPELEAIQKKYGNDQRVLQQKTNEIYKKYQFSMMGTCLPMLVTMILQFVVFLTLWNSLQAVSNYNISYQYENMKSLYANVVALNEENTLSDVLSRYADKEFGTDYNITIDGITVGDDGVRYLNYTFTSTETTEDNFSGKIKYNDEWTNEEISALLDRYVVVPQEENPETSTEQPEGDETTETPAEDPIEYVDTGFNEVFRTLAENAVREEFLATQESFLWIKNIYRSESPSSPLFTESEITGYLSNFYSEEEKEMEETYHYEEKIFNYVIEENAELSDIKAQNNGYYILTIIAVLTSFLSIWLSNKLMKNKNQPAQPGNKIMYFIMSIIIGIFTFMYTSLFAIYLIVGQLVNMALTPLTTLIVKKWIASDAKKKKEKDVIEVDYRRKDM